jgi:hypothetical protein
MSLPEQIYPAYSQPPSQTISPFKTPKYYSTSAVNFWLGVRDQNLLKGKIINRSGEISEIVDLNYLLHDLTMLFGENRGLSFPLTQLYLFIIYFKFNGVKLCEQGSVDVSENGIFVENMTEIMTNIERKSIVSLGDEMKKYLTGDIDVEPSVNSIIRMKRFSFTSIPFIVHNDLYVSHPPGGALDSELISVLESEVKNVQSALNSLKKMGGW